MRIHEIGGELGFIDRVRGMHAGAEGDGLIVGLGDDAAVIAVKPGEQVVVTTDMLVERVHFRREWSDPYSIGWKAAAANLSDLAGMGAVPTFTFISIACTSRETVENLDRLYDGFVDCLNRYGSRLAGGDTNATPENMVISVTQMGTVRAGKALTRAGARVGDILLVTGTLGDSAAGLALLSEYGLARADKVNKDLITIHRRPQPRIVAANAAAATGKVRAAMDITDGIAGDLKKLCAVSNVGARLDSHLLPISEAVRATAELLQKDPVEMALIGGEDYELLLAVAPGDVDDIIAAISGVGASVTAVGEVTKSGFRIVDESGAEREVEGAGWDHFVA
jgi:thiamine-monophosphate kinase